MITSVWVRTARGESVSVYHADHECHRLTMARAKRPITAESAVRRGLKACLRCVPIVSYKECDT